MTTRMTVALSVLGLGLAVAALAGIPAFIENRAIGDVAMLGGFSVAIVGVVLVALAIPGQRRQNAELADGRAAVRRNAEIDVDQLRIVRRRLVDRKATVLAKLGETQATLEAWRMTGSIARVTEQHEIVKRLEVESADLEAELDTNANEFRRLGTEPPL